MTLQELIKAIDPYNVAYRHIENNVRKNNMKGI